MAGIYSCKKGDDSVPTSSTLTTSLNVVNTTTDTLNFYLNGSRVNTTSSLYPFGYTGYLPVPFEDQNYQFKRPRSSDVLFNLQLALDTNKVYSVYIAGENADDTFTTRDTLIADTASRPKIRFVNASPGSGNLNVVINDTLRFSTRAYKTTTVFIPISAGIKHVQIYNTGSTVALSDTSRTFIAGRQYTLFAKGRITGTGGQKFGTGLVVNR
ncbi:hypothetical protein BC343_21215 [Mucilaginibacter pedocola]|uniref:DUF4397 domain-containing protein n=2 Tax=Mucilaginibacter pedocola TaxID=1792845 RepID=A0A1S9PJ62_9SPHI|nr:hypothetical protein BC343_21215 [Mucilaginibacter pedocola]